MSAAEQTITWPLVRACVAEHKPALNLSKLSREDKRAVWDAIQEEKPALAELLQDEGFTALVKHFNGEVIIDLDQLPESVQGMRK